MNTENSQLIEKSRFLAQYWDVEVLYVEGVGLVKVSKGAWDLNLSDFFLQLKPILSITDDDALEASDLLGSATHLTLESRITQFKQLFETPNFWVKQTNIPLNRSLLIFDFLRSKGYALPFMGLSVEKLVELGWVKLSE